MFLSVRDPKAFDSKASGLICGLEIHQQLNTGKLFCSCPSIMVEDGSSFIVKRRLRAVAGESGIVDLAAAHEQFKSKSFEYYAFDSSSCLVELDEEPPHSINRDALLVALQAAKLLNSTLFDKVQVMRKIVIDGSNTGGFQRTLLLGFGGFINGSFGRVGIQTVCLEEDAAKIISRGSDCDSYNLSRLGIPLVEVATDPDLRDPEAVRDAAAFIGMVLRSTGRVKRGLGTIRQDVNLSVMGGSRVEVKGAQDLRSLPQLVRWEASRQLALVDLASALEGLSFSYTSLVDLSSFCSSAKGFVKKTGSLFGLGFPGLKGLFGSELLPGYRVGSELAGYARAHGFGGIIHSDEDLSKYGLDYDVISGLLGDSFILLVGRKDVVSDFFSGVLIPRIKAFWSGVPSEVRRANDDATTSYQRPMPGAARMYPETDIPDVVINEGSVVVPKLLSERIGDFVRSYGLPHHLAKELVDSGFDSLFQSFLDRFSNLSPLFLADFLLVKPKEIKSREGLELPESFFDSLASDILSKVDSGSLPKSAVYELLVSVAKGEDLDFSTYVPLSDAELSRIVRSVISENKGASINALMGLVMARVKGRADGRKVMTVIKDLFSSSDN